MLPAALQRRLFRCWRSFSALVLCSLSSAVVDGDYAHATMVATSLRRDRSAVSTSSFDAISTTVVGGASRRRDLATHEHDDWHTSNHYTQAALVGRTEHQGGHARRLSGNFTSVCDAACQAVQRNALLMLYNTTGGGRTWRYAWNASQPYCSWCGVRCCGPALPFDIYPPCGVQYAIYTLELDMFGLTGSLPATGFVSGLPSTLLRLTLTNNALTGSLPSDLSTASQLMLFSINGNRLSGPIGDVLQPLSALQVLNLNNNRFTGTVPASLSTMQALKAVVVSYNKLTGTVPTSYSCLRSLRSFDVSHNALSGAVPSFMLEVPLLREFSIESNRFAGTIPPINIAQSAIDGYLLQSVMMAHNMITGTVPAFINWLPVSLLDLSNNMLTGTYPQIGVVPTILRVLLNNNRFSGTLPPSALNPGMLELNVHDNHFSGTLPVTFSSALSLQSIDLCNNNLSGQLPETAGQFIGALGIQGTGMVSKTGLPPWLSFSNATTIAQNLNEQALVCSAVIITSTGAVANVDPSYYQYQNCFCSKGFVAAYDVRDGITVHMTCTATKSRFPWYAILILALGVVAVIAGIFCFAYFRLVPAVMQLRSHVLKKQPPGGSKGGHIATIVVTDVESSTELWEWSTEVMSEALSVHDRVLRQAMAPYYGYEVTTEGDAFIVAFHEAADAVAWCIAVQRGLMVAPWPTDLSRHQRARTLRISPDAVLQRQVSPNLRSSNSYSGSLSHLMRQDASNQTLTPTPELGALLICGLRVRMGVATGMLDKGVQLHPVTKRREYQGVVSWRAHAVAELGAGGQILLDDESFVGIHSRLSDEYLIKAGANGEALKRVSRTRSSPSALAGRSSQHSLARRSGSINSLGDGLSVTSHQRSWWHGVVSLSHMGLPAAKAKVEPTSTLDEPSVSRNIHPLINEMAHISPYHREFSMDIDPELMSTTPVSQTLLTPLRTPSFDAPQVYEMIIDEMQAAAKRYFEQNEGVLIIDMGVFELDHAGVGEVVNVMQVMVPGLCERGRQLFPFMTVDAQIMPGYFDAPAATSASLQRSTKSQRDPLPAVTLVFCAVNRYAVMLGSNLSAAQQMMAIYNDTVRRTLLAVGGYECQELQGAFMIAFADAGDAMEWCLMLQEVLLEVCWPDSVLALPDAAREEDGRGNVVWNGPRVKMGIYEGVPSRVIPHSTTGRADYFGTLVNRAARFCHAAAQGGQVVASMDTTRAAISKWLTPKHAAQLEVAITAAAAAGNSAAGAGGAAAAGGETAQGQALFGAPSGRHKARAPTFLEFPASALPRGAPGPPRWRMPHSSRRQSVSLTPTLSMSKDASRGRMERLGSVRSPARTVSAALTMADLAVDRTSLRRSSFSVVKMSSETSVAITLAAPAPVFGSPLPLHRTNTLPRGDSVSTMGLSCDGVQHLLSSSLSRRVGVHKWLWAVSLTVEHLGSYRFKGVAGTHDVVSLSSAVTSRRHYTSHKRSKGKQVVPSCGLAFVVQLCPPVLSDGGAAKA